MTVANPASAFDDSWGETSPDPDRPTPPAAPDDARADDAKPPAVLRGTTRGLEIMIQGKASLDAIASAVDARLAEAPTFFRGCDVRIRVEDGPLPAGGLARLDDLATRFQLRIVEVGAAKADAVPRPSLAGGSAPAAASETAAGTGTAAGSATAAESETATETATESATETAAEAVTEARGPRPEAQTADPERVRAIIGPIRSGVILEHLGHIVVFGDVNPGAEIRAQGNIVVLGRLRGTAHAGIGADAGFILALRLEPQQLRIGRQVARAGDRDIAGAHPEIAHVTGGNIVVERYQGRLPSGLAASI